MGKIVVIGAGVVGLTTARLLQERGHSVVIVAKWLPGDMSIEYTSPYAGAHWRTMAPNSNKLLQDFDAKTYRRFMELAQTHAKEAGIMVIPSEDYYDEDTPDYGDPWFRDIVENFEFIESAELPPTAKVGHRYTTVVINTPHYIQWLMHRFLSDGGQVKRQTLSCLQEAIPSDADAVVNCTGLGARYLVDDTKVFPTRGQTVILRAPHIKKTVSFMTKGQSTYCIPRSDGTVVCGGTKEKNDFNPNPEKAIASGILQRTQALCPELAGCEIVRHAVGLRPSRIGGPRIENETTVKPNGEPITVTHAYGHGGFGVQSSWGAAEYTVALVEKGLVKSKL